MAEAETLQRQLINAQNPDGGWPYGRGSSWTEPTAFALLALQAHGVADSGCKRACLWLCQHQRDDGGWPPLPMVRVSTWVTSVAALALSRTDWPFPKTRSAVTWLLGQMQPESSPAERFVIRLRGQGAAIHPAGGSPWFPHTAAWIAPTALSVLALTELARAAGQPELRSRVRQAQQYILSRRCRDGGWNHGGSRYLSENAVSYPEMTGMALLALAGVPDSELTVPLKLAEAFLTNPGSITALSWLQLGLTQQGRGPRDLPTALPCRTTRDIALRLLALAADSNSNKFMCTAQK